MTDDVAALLQQHGQVLAGPAAAAPPPPAADRAATTREALVLDAACGKGGWEVEEYAREVEFEEQEDVHGTWTACASLLVRLTWGESVHDETGTGHATGRKTGEEAREAAWRLARTSGMKRLAKRFAPCLGQPALRAIEEQLHGTAPRKRPR